MIAHYLQPAVNITMFIIGALIFWHYGGSKNIWESTLCEHAQALLGILIMVVVVYVPAKPCEHSRKYPEEDGSEDQDKSIPDL